MAATDNSSMWGHATHETANQYHTMNSPQVNAGDRLTSMMSINEGDHVLVLGCGTGEHVFKIAAEVGPSGRVVGMDLDTHSIRIARHELGKQPVDLHDIIELHEGNVNDLSKFYGQKFNKIHANALIHWISDKPALYREIAKVAHRGTTLGVCTGDGDSVQPIESVRKWVFDEQGCDPSDFAFFPRCQDFEEQMPAAGFRRVIVSRRYDTHRYENPEAVMRWLQVSTGGKWFDKLGDRKKGHQSMVNRIRDGFTLEDGTSVLQVLRIYAISFLE